MNASIILTNKANKVTLLQNINDYLDQFSVKCDVKFSKRAVSTDYSVDITKKVITINSVSEQISDNAISEMMEITEATFKALPKESSKTFVNTLPCCPTIEESGFYFNENNWKYLTRNILRKKNTIITGPTGTGKTEMVSKIANKLGIPVYIYDMGAMQDPISAMLGTHRIVDGGSKFDNADFVERVQQPGIIVLDELNRAPQMAMNILFPCLDSRRELRVDIAGGSDKRVVKVHPECVFIATANIGAEYTGTQEIDKALFNRFMPLMVNYIPFDAEINLLKNKFELEEKAIMGLVTFANSMRNQAKLGNIESSMSTREVLEVAELMQDGFEIYEAVNYVILNKVFDEDEVNQIKALLLEI
jgi:MoxR-like ATPase